MFFLAVNVHIGSTYGTPVYTITATDPESDSLTYELSSEDECPFMISDSKDIIYVHICLSTDR